jgi:predicted N-formylglutamate amidohydrolase
MTGAAKQKNRLLAGEEAPTIILNESGRSAYLIVCEHAGRKVPRALKSLGLAAHEFDRHIAYDIGAEQVARGLSQSLDAPLVLQRYSRLVYDCNRPPDSPSAIPTLSELTEVPGNHDLDAAQRRQRIEGIYDPFHREVARLIDERQKAGAAVVFVTIHSFTPIFKGITRRLHVGLLFDRDRRLTDQIAPLLRDDGRFDVRCNEPYGPADGVCHTLNVHAGARGLPYSMIEIRNDLISSESGQREWSDRLAVVLRQAAKNIKSSTATAGSRQDA